MDSHISSELRRFNHLLGETEGVYHEAALRLGLSDSGMKVLYAICNEGDRCPLRTVCRLSGMSKQTVNSALRKLEAEGTVYLEPAGARNKDVCLTERGRELVRRTVIPLMELEDEIYASWTREEIQIYLALTQRFLAALRENVRRLSCEEKRTL